MKGPEREQVHSGTQGDRYRDPKPALSKKEALCWAHVSLMWKQYIKLERNIDLSNFYSISNKLFHKCVINKISFNYTVKSYYNWV